jgi:NTP pyrophosphatase (non-canonical NTP hydrolase)
MSGHDLSRKQIAKHGRDRYPTIAAQYSKVLDEMGELGETLIVGMDPEDQKREYADVGLALFELGNKLGLDLIACMAEVVDGDKRDFRD